MKSLFSLIALIAMSTATMAQASAIYGDVDGDGFVTSSDITALYSYFLDGDMTNFANCDVDGDGSVNSYDITEVYNILLGIAPSGDNHEYVDLGLPSGTLWATMNIGASSPEEFGEYFAWGETTSKEVYDWSTYQWCNGRWNTMTKYCTITAHGYNGFVDDKTELDPEDDAATANWGSEWCMPSKEQQDELRSKCTWQWTTRNGVNGYLVTSKQNGESIFLPAAGYSFGVQTTPYSTGSQGYYWSRTLYPTKSYQADYFWFYSNNVDWYYGDRDTGYSVRAVRVSQK